MIKVLGEMKETGSNEGDIRLRGYFFNGNNIRNSGAFVAGHVGK